MQSHPFVVFVCVQIVDPYLYTTTRHQSADGWFGEKRNLGVEGY